MSPQPLINYQSEYWCSELLIDLDYDSIPCHLYPEYDSCRQCLFREKQDYAIVVQDPNQKHLISPERK